MTPTATGQFESVEHARKTYEILHKAWWNAYGQKDKHPEEYILIYRALHHIKEEAAKQYYVPSKSYPDAECESCRQYSVFGGPRHFASDRCRSNKHAHCSCGICF